MGLRITVDIFSGRQNPTWNIEDPNVVREVLQLVARNRAAIAAPYSGYTGLGFRGIQVEIANDVEVSGIPPQFELAGGGSSDEFGGAELAERLLDTMPSAQEARAAGVTEEDLAAFSDDFKNMLREEIRKAPFERAAGVLTVEPTEVATETATEVDEQFRALEGRLRLPCAYDATPFNPAFWNRPDTQPYNNCYNFAVNRRTNTFAQPGRAHGYTIPHTVRCNEVAEGALRDGLRMWGNCQPPGIYRYILAMVTGTFPGGFRDYHWYRYHSGGFWAHKPGGGAARNTDNSGAVIYNPYMCNRYPYSEWCGFLQSHNTVVIK